MDLPEPTKILYNRIQKFEPVLFSKIFGYILLKYGDREMDLLAHCPEHSIHSLINEAKAAIPGLSLSPKSTGLAPKPTLSAPTQAIPDLPLQFASYSPAGSRPLSSPAALHVPAPYWDPQALSDQQASGQNVDFVLPPYSNSIGEDYLLHDQVELLNLEEHLDPMNHMGLSFPSNYYYQEAATGGGLTPRTSRRSPSLPEFPVKACLYYFKGYCKHGTNCRYLHGQSVPDSFSQIFSPNSNEFANEDHMFAPGSLEKLEVELTELLKSKGGQPISIATLPLMYYEKYGKVLQADGYLTESQRHGKSGFSLTKLLARLKNSIRLLDRPHGQHSVILADEGARHVELRTGRSDPGPIATGSQQIYLTFPAESTFTMEDVADYFSRFGPVVDVRIPCQTKRMFGFVSFEHAETVKYILSKGNPHFVCGARVLVKPYKEKSRLIDRKYSEKMEPQMCYPHCLEMDPELHSFPRFCNNSPYLRKHLIDEHEQSLDLELQRRLCDLQLAPRSLMPQSYFGYSMEENISEDMNELPSAEHLSYQPDVLNNGPSVDDRASHVSNNYCDQDSLGLCLPDSPFTSTAVSNNISAVIQ